MASIKAISKCAWSATNPLQNPHLIATIIAIYSAGSHKVPYELVFITSWYLIKLKKELDH